MQSAWKNKRSRNLSSVDSNYSVKNFWRTETKSAKREKKREKNKKLLGSLPDGCW